MMIPAIGSKYHWAHILDRGRIVRQIITEDFGVYVVYAETYTNGEPYDIKICSLKSWNQAVNGKGKYLSALIAE